MENPGSPMEPGRRLLHYQLTGKIGEGGMGVVWRATDTTLGRSVALKLLPSEVSRDAERLARFDREARLLAALHHPGIASIFGFHREADPPFLAMELVEGEDLAARLARGALPAAEALEIATQIAEALEAAHEQGVIHRDLKPANIRLTPDGRAKILDFGLAKALLGDVGSSGSDLSLSPTLAAGTAAGIILGTAAYMSPEQARGKQVDRRTDLWSFGCILYEMLTGRRAFDGETVTDVLAAVLTRDPEWSALPAELPPALRRVLRRCLEKDPRRRLRDAGDARWMLQEETRDEPAGAAAPARVLARRPALAWVVSAVMGTALVALLIVPWRGGSAGPSGAIISLSVKLPADVRLNVSSNVGEHALLAISPDGRQVAFVGEEQAGRGALYVRSFDGFGIRRIEGSEGASGPFHSPDGRWIGFFAGGMLKKVDAGGGRPVDLCEVGLNRGGAWGPDGAIVFSPSSTSALMRIGADGGTPEALTQLDASRQERTHRWPVFLPGGREVAFTVGVLEKAGDYDDARIEAVDLATGRRRVLVQGASMARVAGGRLILGRQGALFAVALDQTGKSLRLASRPVLQGVAGVPASGVLHADISATGDLIYAEDDPHATRNELIWITRDGVTQPLGLPDKEYRTPRLSRDGKSFAVAVGPGRGRDSEIWVHDVQTGSGTRLTFGDRGSTPMWSPDGPRVTHIAASGTFDRFVMKAADGSDEGTTVASFPDVRSRAPLDWSPDMRRLLFMQDSGAGRQNDIFVLNLPGGDVEPFATTPSVEWAGALSRDGRWVAYSCDELGEPEVFVRPFDGSGGKWQISDGGTLPRWSADGAELYYVNGLRMMAVKVAAGGSFSAGPPRDLFTADFIPGNESMANYDVGPDGRFLAVRGRSAGHRAGHFNVVLNWAEHLERGATAP